MKSSKNLFLAGVVSIVLLLLTMGIFNFFKRPAVKAEVVQNIADAPYKDSSANSIYNLLFCDDVSLYKSRTQQPDTYPFNILFSQTSTPADLQKVIDDTSTDSRVKVLAYNRQRTMGHQPDKKELLAVIVEVGVEEGLDALASFKDGTARYINQTGKILIWETPDDAQSNKLTHDLFANSQQIINQIGPWYKGRKTHPEIGNTRITFLVSDGLYFGEAPTDVLFKDSLAEPALMSATQLLQYLTTKSLEENQRL